MAIQVMDEISPLKQVLLHRPGAELEQLTPDSLNELLFDDIPYLAAAQKEHDCFADALRENGAQVLYLEELMAATLEHQPHLKAQFIADFIAESGPVARHLAAELTAYLTAIEDAYQLVLTTMSGLRLSKLQNGRRGALVRLLAHDPRFVLPPIPNLYFTRDPFASVGQGACLNQMYSQTRNRETIYARYILQHHRDYAGRVPFYYTNQAPFSLEGGDLLNLSAEVLAIGISQRTSAEAIELLAQNLFSDPDCRVRTILALDIPNLRAYMHLDTVFTQVSREQFTIHPAILPPLSVYRLQRRGDSGDFQAEYCQQSLVDILKQTLGLATCELIHCGGQDQVASAREQWNDGANTLAIAPGKVIVYDRNTVTNQILAQEGVTTIKIPSSELSRGRGGPRCMSMPLLREA